MRPKPTSIRLAVCAALGVVALAPAAQAASVLPNGVYLATINPTPYTAQAKFAANGSPTASALIVPKTSSGAWNSTFSFSRLPGRLSQGMTNNSVDIPCGSASGTCGSSKSGNGAGSWDMTVNGGKFTTSNFQADAIFATAGGTFVEYGSLKGGTIDQSTGAMTLDPTGRLGSVSNFSSTLYDEPWNIPDNPLSPAGTLGPTYAPLITGSSTNPSGTVTGSPITSNGDGTYNVVLVSASQVGVDWGGFDGNPYIETWNVNLKPLLMDDTPSAVPGELQTIDVESNDPIAKASNYTLPIELPLTTSANGATLKVVGYAVTYATPASFFTSTGTDTFQYQLKTKSGVTLPATVTVALGARANPDTASTSQSPQGKAVTIDVLKNDSIPSGAVVTVKITTLPKHGVVTILKANNQVVYTPTKALAGTPGFAGTDTFKYVYTYTDTKGAETVGPATVTVTVNAAFQAASSIVSVGPGTIATADGTSGLVTLQQLLTAKKPIPLDSGVSQQCIGGCFDFKVTGVLPGGQAKVAMLPLTKPIPSGARLRKYKYISKKWQDFDTSNGDSVASAPGSATSCPLPSSTSYKTGLTAGDYCVRLTITDGGPNDGDGLANGAITDPSGIATGAGTSGATGTSGASAPTTDFKGLGSGGCALGTDASPWHGGSWWLIGAVIGWLGFSRRRRSPQRS